MPDIRLSAVAAVAAASLVALPAVAPADASAAKFGARTVHFSEIQFLGSLEDEHVRKVGEHAASLGIEVRVPFGQPGPSRGGTTRPSTAARPALRLVDRR